MKRSFDSGLLKPACDQLVALFAADGVPVGRAKAHEILAAALGFWTYKLARDHVAPLSVRRFHTSPRHRDSLPHLRLVTERIERVLEVAPFTAMRLAPQALAVVAEHGIVVDGLCALFDAHLPEADKLAIFKAIDDPDSPPTRATSAIGRGLIPPPPRRNLAERFSDAAPTLFNSVAKAAEGAYLWVEPNPRSRKGDIALQEDSYSTHGPDGTARAGLGADFVVLIPDAWANRRTVSVIRPTLRFSSQGKHGWQVEFPAGSTSHRDRPGDTMDDIVGSRVEGLPRLYACHRCLSLYADDVPGLGHHCKAPVDGRKLEEVFEHLQVTQAHPPTTARLVEMLAERGADVTSTDELEAFITRNRWTLHTRQFNDGTWFVRQEPQWRPSPDGQESMADMVAFDADPHA